MEERALTKEKLEDLKLWEDELKLREECFENNRSIKKMRDALMKLLQSRPQWHVEEWNSLNDSNYALKKF